MKTAGRILGTALFMEGYEVQDAPRYGAERRGAPILAYVSASKQTINERGIIGKPDLIVLADDSLLEIPAAGVLSSVTERTVMLLCTAERAEVWRKKLHLSGPLIVLTAPSEGEGLHENRSISSACGARRGLTVN
jgi:pyruvate ferredoxin oxidoreductase gamma subunit